jgi:hypothetical protein
MPKKTVVLTTLLASLLAVGVAPARADHPDRSRPHTRIEVSRLEVLSHRLERSVRHLQREARRCTDDRRHREHKALPALHRLEKRASRFRHLVERRPGAVPRLIADFRAVDESFRVAEARVQRMRSRHLRHEFRRVGALVEELDRELQRKVRFAQRGSPGHVGNHSRYSGYREFAWRW